MYIYIYITLNPAPHNQKVDGETRPRRNAKYPDTLIDRPFFDRPDVNTPWVLPSFSHAHTHSVSVFLPLSLAGTVGHHAPSLTHRSVSE